MFCYTYNAFFNLNIRFENLPNDLSFPIKISFSSLLYTYYHPYQHQIKSLDISNPFIIDLMLSSVSPSLKSVSFTMDTHARKSYLLDE